MNNSAPSYLDPPWSQTSLSVHHFSHPTSSLSLPLLPLPTLALAFLLHPQIPNRPLLPLHQPLPSPNIKRLSIILEDLFGKKDFGNPAQFLRVAAQHPLEVVDFYFLAP